MQNPYIPISVKILNIINEVATRDIKTFQVDFKNQNDKIKFNYLPGQFAELSIYGQGEIPIGIASSPTQKLYLEFTVQKAGKVTTALHNMEEGQEIGIRGPLGKSWPINFLEGKNIVIVGGGFAFTTLRSLINYILDKNNRNRFGEIMIIYGARSPGLLCYKQELTYWQTRNDINIYITVDKKDKIWQGKEGFVPTICSQLAPSFKNTVSLICGPPIMIKFTIPIFLKLGFSKENIFTSLEMRMKCGIGKCGRCNIGHKYLCKDGPIFSLAELDEINFNYY